MPAGRKWQLGIRTSFRYLKGMGIFLWFAAGICATIIARWLPPTHRAAPRRRLGEWFVSLLTALLAGALATALDFGGWNELEWRATVFSFFVSLTAIGLYRLTGAKGPRG